LLSIFGVSNFDTNNKYTSEKIEEGLDILNRSKLNKDYFN